MKFRASAVAEEAVGPHWVEVAVAEVAAAVHRLEAAAVEEEERRKKERDEERREEAGSTFPLAVVDWAL